MSNYPPGVTTSDIDRNAGTLATCPECGREYETEPGTLDSQCPRCANDNEETL